MNEDMHGVRNGRPPPDLQRLAPAPPHNDDAEEAVIGGILFAGRTIEQVARWLGPGDFYHPALQAICCAALELREQARPIDIITVAEQMRAAGTFARLTAHQGEAYLAELANKVATVENIEHHARIVRRDALRRRELELRSEALQRALAGLATAAQDLELGQVKQALAELDGQGRPPLRTIRISDVPDPGAPRYLVKPLWTAGAFGFVGAEPKAWKTWITLSIAISVASGRDLFKRFHVERTGRVLVLSAEGGKGLARHRVSMLCRAMELDIASLDLELLDVDALRLDQPAQAAALLATVEARRPVLLILDPLRELHTGDENDSAVITGLLGPLRTMQARLDVAIMVVHHSGKTPSDGNTRKRGGQRLRGSSALHGASDSALYLTVDGEGEQKRVRVQAEHRAAVEPEAFTLAMRERAVEDGTKALWLEIVNDDSDEQEAERTIAKREKDRAAILRVIRLAAMPGRTPLRSKAAVAKAAKMRPATVGPLLDELIAEAAVLVGEGGGYRICEPAEGGAEDAPA